MAVEAGFGLFALGMIVSVIVLIILIEVRKHDDDKSED